MKNASVTLPTTAGAENNNDDIISIGSELSVLPGQKKSGILTVSTNRQEGNDNDNAQIPITVVRGLPSSATSRITTLVIFAGIHGSEYTPIVTTQKLAQTLDPAKDLQPGTSVILVHIANLPSYSGRTVYQSPLDQKNLNRVFPGSHERDASITEVIADALLSQVILPYADYVMDMHSGDANEQLGPTYTAYYGKAGTSQVQQVSKEMAHAFGSRLVVEFQLELRNDTSNDSDSAIWTGAAAVVRGIPSIDVEMAPGMGLYDSSKIEENLQGIWRVMKHLNILAFTSADTWIQKTNNINADKIMPRPCLIQDRDFLEAPVNGSWVPLVDVGTYIPRGTRIGYVTDWYGRNVVYEALAPRDGLLLIRFEAPPVNERDTVAVVGVWDTDSNHNDGDENFAACWNLVDELKSTSKTKGWDLSSLIEDGDISCQMWRIVNAGGWLAVILLLVLQRIGVLSRRTTAHRDDAAQFARDEEQSELV